VIAASKAVRGFGAVIMVGLALLVVAGCSESPSTKKQKALERGERYLSEGKANEAVIELRNALQVDPDFVPALHALGRAYVAKVWYADALRELERAQKLAPDSQPVTLAIGRIYLETGVFAEALTRAEKILSREPNNSEALAIKAAALLGQGKTDEALAVVESAPAGAIAEADQVRAGVLLRLGKSDEAEKSYRAVLATRPGDFQSLLGLGGIHLGREKYDEAVKLYGEARKLRPFDPRPRLGLAAVKARSGQVADAIRELEEVDPRARSGSVILALATYYLQANRPNDAQRLLEPVVQRFPTLAPARYLLGVAYLANSRADLAVAQFEELARQAPNDSVVRLQLAATYSRLGKGKEALGQLDLLAKVYEKLPGYHIERGRALTLLGKTDEALQAARTAQRLAPESTLPYLLMGQIYMGRGDNKAAREMFARASELRATDAGPHLALGRLAWSEKNPDVALKEFDAALTADPKSIRAARAKVGLLVQQNRTKEAIQFTEGLVQREPNNPGFQTILGSLYGRDRQWEKSSAAYRKSAELSPKVAEPRLGLAQVALSQGKDEEAITHLQGAVQLQPGHPLAVLMIAGLYDRLARYDQAISVLEAAVKADPSQPTFGLGLGEMYLKKGRYDDAITKAGELLSANPNLAGARLIRGQALLAKGDPNAAKDFIDVARMNPKLELAQYLLARAYAQSGRVPDAQAAYREAIRINPEFKQAKTELALLSGQKPDQGELLKEIEQLRAAVKATPKDLAARERLARRLLASGQVKPAQEELKAVLEIAPAHPDANLLMGSIAAQEGRPDDAANYARAVLRTNPSHVDANLFMAAYLLQGGRGEEAVRHLEAALLVNPNRSDVKFRLGVVYVQQRRLADALRLARELQKSEPKSPAGLLLMGTVSGAQQKPQEAIEAFNSALKLKGDLADAYRGLGQAYQQLNQADRAAEAYQRAVGLNGKDVASLNNLAWLLSEVRKKPDEALPLATKAEQLAPKSAEVLDTLGWIQYRRGAFPEAEKALLRAAERAPGNGTIQYHLGMTYARLGKKQDAVSTLKRAAQLDPKLGEAEKINDVIKQLGG
jgi:tetratricopeptide (TPR) repeat protein